MSVLKLVQMTPSELHDYFMKNVRYFQDNPEEPYYIRVGAMGLFARDTHELRKKFDDRVAYWKVKYVDGKLFPKETHDSNISV